MVVVENFQRLFLCWFLVDFIPYLWHPACSWRAEYLSNPVEFHK